MTQPASLHLPRPRQPLLSAAGWFWLIYLAGLGAVGWFVGRTLS